jgi:serine/threonine protein kinase
VLQPESPTQGEQGRLFGTPAYLAPETAQTGHADARSDVYSVAVVFYEMLTGHVPIEGASTAETLQKHICQLPEPPRKRNPHVEITPEAERVILRGLEKDPGRRQASMGELWQELQRCYGAMRWRRPSEPLESGLPFETLRAPPPQASVERVSILREPVRPENTPTPPHGVGYAPEPAKHKPQAPLPEEIPTPPPAGIENRPRPLLLTKRKSAPRPAVVNPDEEITPPLVRQR